MAQNGRPQLDLMAPMEKNIRILSMVIRDYMKKNQTSLEDAISILIFSALEPEDVDEELESSIIQGIARAFGVDVVNTPDDITKEALKDADEIDKIFDSEMDLDSTPVGMVHDISFIHEDSDDDDD